MISASPLAATFPRVRRADAEMALALSPHEAVSRVATPVTNPALPASYQVGMVLEPLVLLLAATGVSLLMTSVVAGWFG